MKLKSHETYICCISKDSKCLKLVFAWLPAGVHFFEQQPVPNFSVAFLPGIFCWPQRGGVQGFFPPAALLQIWKFNKYVFTH